MAGPGHTADTGLTRQVLQQRVVEPADTTLQRGQKLCMSCWHLLTLYVLLAVNQNCSEKRSNAQTAYIHTVICLWLVLKKITERISRQTTSKISKASQYRLQVSHLSTFTLPTGLTIAS